MARTIRDVEQSLQQINLRVADLERSVKELCEIVEWCLVRFATKTDSKDIKEKILPRLDLAMALVGPDDTETDDSCQVDIVLPGWQAPLDGADYG